MADGGLEAMIRNLRELATLVPDATPDAAKAVERELGAQISEGVDPDGKPWPLTKDGRPALERAARALRVRPVGMTIVARLEGHHALHNRGWVRGGVRRQILPSSGVPARLANAIRDALTERFEKTAGAS